MKLFGASIKFRDEYYDYRMRLLVPQKNVLFFGTKMAVNAFRHDAIPLKKRNLPRAFSLGEMREDRTWSALLSILIETIPGPKLNWRDRLTLP